VPKSKCHVSHVCDCSYFVLFGIVEGESVSSDLHHRLAIGPDSHIGLDELLHVRDLYIKQKVCDLSLFSPLYMS